MPGNRAGFMQKRVSLFAVRGRQFHNGDAVVETIVHISEARTMVRGLNFRRGQRFSIFSNKKVGAEVPDAAKRKPLLEIIHPVFERSSDNASALVDKIPAVPEKEGGQSLSERPGDAVADRVNRLALFRRRLRNEEIDRLTRLKTGAGSPKYGAASALRLHLILIIRFRSSVFPITLIFARNTSS